MDNNSGSFVGLQEFESNTETFFGVLKKLKDVYDGKIAKTYSTGFEELDDTLMLQTKRMMVITGSSGRGKSFWVNNLLFQTNKLHGWKHLICSLEGESEDMFEDLVQMKIRKSVREPSGYGGQQRMTREEYVETAEGFGNDFIRFNTEELWDVDSIIEYARFAVAKYDIKTLTIDPYNKLNSKNSAREDKEIALMLNKLLTFARQADILIIFVAHPTTFASREKNYIPTIYDISGGGTWMNMCDYGISIHRYLDMNGFKRSQTKVVVHKVKSRAIGDPSGGIIHLNYNFNDYALKKPSYGSEIYKEDEIDGSLKFGKIEKGGKKW